MNELSKKGKIVKSQWFDSINKILKKGKKFQKQKAIYQTECKLGESKDGL